MPPRFSRLVLLVTAMILTSALTLIAVLAGGATAAFARSSEAPDEAGDRSWVFEEEIEVEGREDDGSLIERESETATRTRTPLRETPQSIQVLTRKLIEEQEIRTLDEALVNVSGVAPSKPQELVLQQPIVRGFAAEIFVDGLQAFGLTPVVDSTSLINAERVEVLKGPSSTLFGGGIGAPLGGLVNLVSKRPQRAPRHTAGLRFGDFNTVGAFFDFNQPVGEGAAFRVTGEVEESDGHIDRVEAEKYSLFPSLAIGLGESTELVLRGQLSRVENLEYAGLPASITVGGEFGVDPFRFSGASNAPRTEIENLLLTGRLEHRFSPAWRGVFEARYYDSSFEEFASFPFFSFFPPDPARPTELAIIRGQLPTDVEQITLSSRAEWDLGGSPGGGTEGAQHRLLAGVEVDRTDYQAASGFDFRPIGVLDYADPDADLDFGPVPELDTFQDDLYQTLAFFIQDQIRLGGRVHLLAGLRFTRLGVEQHPSLDETYDEVTPRLGLTVDVGSGMHAFAGYSEGFRGVLFFAGNDTLPEPEESEHAEVGLKIARADHGLQGTVALYELTRSNVPTPDPAFPFAQVQSGEQRARGLEMDLVWEPGRRWSLLLAYAFADSEIVEDNLFPVGDRLVRVPEHSGRLALRYRIPHGRWGGLGVGLGLSAGGERELTLPNQERAESYALLDLQASYRIGPATLSLSVVNLTDEDLFEPYQYLAQAVVIPTRPRSFFGTLRWVF